MTVEITLINCPHCTRLTSTVDTSCVYCFGFLDMGSVLIAESCETSVVDGSTVGVEGPIILMTYECRRSDTESTPITIAVRAKDVSGLRSSLLDRLMSVGVRIQNGRQQYDEASNSSDGR